MEDRTKFADNLMDLLRQIVTHLKAHDEAIEELKVKDTEIEHQLDIIFENQIGHQAICGDS